MRLATVIAALLAASLSSSASANPLGDLFDFVEQNTEVTSNDHGRATTASDGSSVGSAVTTVVVPKTDWPVNPYAGATVRNTGQNHETDEVSGHAGLSIELP